jgi:tetratricopeptide (TPR) repeat protein
LTDHGGNLDEALKFAQTSREMAPEDANVADTLGWIYYKKGLIDTSYPLVSFAARRAERNPAVRYHHGMVLMKMGKKKEAAAELKTALALENEFPGAEEARKALADIGLH